MDEGLVDAEECFETVRGLRVSMEVLERRVANLERGLNRLAMYVDARWATAAGLEPVQLGVHEED